jgi:hypothetical protein
MMTSLKTYTVLCAAVASTISLTSCGSDSSNNANNESGQKTFLDNLDMSVDEEAQILTVSNDGTDQAYCVAVDDSFKWKTFKSKPTSNTIKYDFIGDTLVLYEWQQNSERYDQYGLMLVGGKGGNIYGTWTPTPCMFDSQENETNCNEDGEAITRSIYTISENTFSKVSTSYHINQKLNYPASSFRYVLNTTISKGPGYIPTANELFHESSKDIDENTKFNGITTKSISASGETLTAGGKTIVVNIENFTDDDGNWTAAVTISVDGKTCRNEYERYFDLTESLCKAEFSEYYDLSTKTDKDGNEFKYVSLFRKNNNDEFTECLEPLIYPISESISESK